MFALCALCKAAAPHLASAQTDCLCIDVVDTMATNSLITLPSLLGLSPQFDAKGKDVVTVYHAMTQLAKVRVKGQSLFL